MRRKKFNFDPIKIIAPIGIVGILLIIVFGFVHEYNTHIDSGIITDKDYYSGYTSYYYINKQAYPQYHPSKYFITIQGDKNGETVEYSFEVDETTYHQYKIGQSYP